VYELCLILLLCAGACGGSAPSGGSGGPAARHVLLVTFDTTRADHLSIHGGQARVPNLERLAAEGVQFDAAFAPTPLTLPSHVSLFTGQYPASHGVHNNGTFVLSDEAMSLTEVLRAQGFQTGAVVGSLVLDSRYGLAQGFEVYDDQMPAPPGAATLYVERRAAEVADRALAWLDAREDQRWFLWLHFFDPHWEYQPPEPFGSQYPDSPYDGEIAYADQQLGRVLGRLEERGWLDETLVVLTSDHGESLDEHGEATHGLFVYDATMHVPLLLRHPARLDQGRNVSSVASLVDVAPTILDLLGVPGDALPATGRSLLPVLAGKADGAAEVLLETRAPRLDYGWSELAAVRDEGWKYIRAPRPELYDLQADPFERTNVIDQEPERARAYAARLKDLEAALADVAPTARQQPLDPEARRAMESLGYLSTGAGGQGSGADPKDKIVEMQAIQDAVGLVFHGRNEEAILGLQTLLLANPDSGTLHRYLGNAFLQAGRIPEAIAEYERCAQIDPQDFGVHTSLGGAYMRLGDAARAERSFRAALALTPHVAEAHHNLGLLAQGRGDAQTAITHYESALEEDPTLVRSATNLGLLYEQASRPQDAVRMYLRVAQLEPANVRALFSAAFILVQNGAYQEGLVVLDQARAVDPSNPLPHVYRAQVYQRLGDLDAAERELEAALALDPNSADAQRSLEALQQRRSGG
jgi:arylsulfatase A-like enzyme/Tfp pilus assembly protein PilF